MAEMTLEEKVGQLFFGFVYAETLDDASIDFLKQSRLGNVVYYRWANGMKSPEQVGGLSSQLHEKILEITGASPLIAVDQEGGVVNRLTEGFSVCRQQNLWASSTTLPSFMKYASGG